MLTIGNQSSRFCSGLSRRALLRVGALGLTGLTLADVLRARAQGASRTAPADDLSIILVWLDGGPPQHETYDPKPDAPSDYRGPLGAIATRVPGIQLSELLPLHAGLMDRMAIIRSMHHNNQDHFAAAHWMLTGYLGSNAINMAPMYPSMASIIARLKGARREGLPAYVGLPNTHSVGLTPGYHGAAYLGNAYNPFSADGDPNHEGYSVQSLNLPAGLNPARMEQRRTLLSAFDGACERSRLAPESGDEFTEEAFDMLTGTEARQAFQIGRESPKLRDRYGRNTWGQSALVARRLVEAGVRFVTLTYGGWDWHSNLDKGMHDVLPRLDAAVATLIDDLEQRGLLDSTLVIVMGEFGRTPKINQGLPQDPIPGRDHWGNVMSVLLAGGGVAGGQIVGTSNARGESPKELPTTPADLVASIYNRLGLDPDTTFHDRVNRPITIVPQGGRPIPGLFS